VKLDGQTFPFIHDDDYVAISTLAHLSMGHHGEYIGRANMICALHAVTARRVPRFLYAKSTDAISGYQESTQKFSNMPFVGRVEELLPHLPSHLVVETLTNAFFAQVNWRYGIPEAWFRGAQSQMWANLHHSSAPGADGKINANWLMLLFAVIASAPRSDYKDVQQRCMEVRDSDDYFMCAMMARRLVEDEYLDTPNASFMVSAADGTVLGCLAAPLLCNYLAQRGRISEAWKLAGHAIRNAEAVGMHRDPDWKRWQMMSADEKLLRRRGWWNMFIADKMYAYALSRPQVLRREIFDVEYCSIYNQDGSRDRFNVGQTILVNLMELIGEALEKVSLPVASEVLIF